MLNIPEKVVGITHPLVHEVYLKKHFTYDQNREDVLVIETIKNNNKNTNADFLDLLIDLQEIQNQAKEKIGHFDRIDIISH